MREYSITREGQSGIAADDDSILDEIISLTGGAYTLTVSDPEEDEPLPVETELQKLERLSLEANNKADYLEHLYQVARSASEEAHDRFMNLKSAAEAESQDG